MWAKLKMALGSQLCKYPHKRINKIKNKQQS